jgi:glutamine amidotransferase
MIVIIDYGMGNIGSIFNMLKKIGCRASVSADPNEIWKAEKLILPGVGAFDHGIRNLAERNLISLLNEKVVDGRCPMLGICLGMQLLSNRSEEGQLPGLGWIAAETRRFKFGSEQMSLKVPHMGWNEVRPHNQSTLFKGFDEIPRFYFVHSYHVCCERVEDILATSYYGCEFVAAVKNENVMGTQFHPEKSHRFGMQLLRNFVSL